MRQFDETISLTTSIINYIRSIFQTKIDCRILTWNQWLMNNHIPRKVLFWWQLRSVPKGYVAFLMYLYRTLTERASLKKLILANSNNRSPRISGSLPQLEWRIVHIAYNFYIPYNIDSEMNWIQLRIWLASENSSNQISLSMNWPICRMDRLWRDFS
jgi:hypothetical protein